MEPRIALVSMPWTTVSDPALGLAILKAQLAREGIQSRVFHQHLRLLRYVTGATYSQVSVCWALNEFVFTGALDEQPSQDQADCLLERCHAHAGTEAAVPYPNPVAFGEALIRLRHEVAPQYLADCASEILAYEPTMVGFSCMFDQTMASAALARLIRQHAPTVQVVFGGYALEGPPGVEVLRAFPQIDAVAVGDGEPIIGPLALASVGRGALSDIPGVMTQANSAGLPRQKYEIDDSPAPDYSDWYADLACLRKRDRVTVSTTLLPVESSRGCWWGQKQHCVFCGIDEDTLVYRMKKPETVLAQLAHLREQYGVDTPFRFSDYILPHNYVSELLPRLAEVRPKYELQCEIKANQNEERMQAFSDAGFTELQPGIESFDSAVLNLMKKGVRGIQNVQTLKLGYLHGIVIHYNLLYGIPGEKAESYQRMVGLLPRLYHLIPPISRTEAIVTRFAPLHTTPNRFGTGAQPRHHRCYDALFSTEFLERTGFSLDNYAYYFERYFDYDPEVESFYSLLIRTVDHWKRQHLARPVFLSWEADGDELRIRDARFGQTQEAVLDPLTARVYLACDRCPKTRSALARELELTPASLESAISTLDDARLIWQEDDQVIGLATPAGVFERHRERGWQTLWTAIYC